MIAATSEQGAALIFALRREFTDSRSGALRALIERTRSIMEAALDAADKAALASQKTEHLARRLDALETEKVHSQIQNPMDPGIFEMQQSIINNKLQNDALIRGVKSELTGRLVTLGDNLKNSQKNDGARESYNAALAFLEEGDESARQLIEQRLAALDY